MGTSSNTILDYNLVRFGVCMIKLRHERMLILRSILPPKTRCTRGVRVVFSVTRMRSNNSARINKSDFTTKKIV